MSIGFAVAVVVLLGGYALLYKMAKLWNGSNPSFSSILWGGCGA